MNLLNNQSDSENKIQSTILKIFNDIGISVNNMKIANEFFDFSTEINLDLIKNVEFQDLENCDYTLNNRSRLILSDLEGKDYDYSDRYILFLDAIGGNTIYNLLSHNIVYAYTNKYYKEFANQLLHAFSKKYEEDDVKAKLLALFAENSQLTEFPQILKDNAKKAPKIVISAAKKYCCGKYANSESKLCSLALAYSDPVTNKNDEDINYAVERILKISECSDLNNINIFEFTMCECFMAVNHSEKIEEYIKEKITGKLKDFFIAVITIVPNSYFENNIDKLVDITEIEKSESDISECIKIALAYAWRGEGYKAEYFLNYAAKKYPKQFVELMYSTESVNAHCAAANRRFYDDLEFCYYYKDMYQVLEKENPQAIKDYNIDFKSDILKLSIQSEQEYSNIAKEEIGKYLNGESDLSILKPYFYDLTDAYTNLGTAYKDNARLIDACIKIYPDFQNRYLAFKTIQRKSTVSYKVRSTYRQDKYDYIQKIVNALISEKIPNSHRFSLYELIHEDLYSDADKEKVEDIVTKSMVAVSETYDEEYESFCPVGGVFTRKVYVRYLDLTNDGNNKNKDRLLSMCSDTSKEIRRVVTEVISKHKEYENEVLELLKAKKSAVREAAIDILSIWGANNYQDILLATAESEKSAKLADKIRTMLNISETVSTSEDSEGNIFSPVNFVETIHKGGKNKKLLWLYASQNPVVHFNNGTEADDKYIQAIMLCYSNMTTFGISESANLLAKELKQDELNKFASEIFSKWISDGAESKKKWVLYFCAIHGGYNMLDIILHYIKEWSENSRGAIASEAVKAIAFNGSSAALMSVDNIAHKFKHKQVKNAAIQALDNAAEELGITPDELGDRIVPDLGFNENMERIFDYGTRKFKVYLTPSLELEIYDENDKKLKNMPAPSKKDNEEIAKQSNTEFKQMKKQLKNVISIQKLRLETALLADRRWNKEAWNNLFVKNPVMHSFAIGLIWAAYENDYDLVQTFRYMEDGSFNTSDEDEYTLPDNCTIGLVHPIDLDEDTLSTWKEQLSDYEITQPIEQLERTVYRINNDEIGMFDLNRFKGRKLNDMTLLGRTTKLGWYKGSVQDAGGFNTFYREDISKRIKNDDGTTVRLVGNAVELHFSGMYVGGMGEEVEIENVRFYTPGTVKRGSYMYDEADDQKAIKLEKINPRYFSEIVNQLEIILKGTEGTD